MARSQILRQNFSEHPFIWIFASFVWFMISWCIYHLLLSPLRDIPGPFFAKISPFWLVFQCRKAQRSMAVSKQHEKHGKFVRVAPNHISISDPRALQEIYGHKSGFTKGPFYEDMCISVFSAVIQLTLWIPFHQVRPVIFNTRDTQVHQRKRKYLNPAFSAQNLSQFEKYMVEDILRLKFCCDRKISVAEGKLDFCRYSNFLAFDVIGNYAFGAPFGFLESEHDDSKLTQTIDARGEVLNALGSLGSWWRFLAPYFFADPFWFRGLRASSNIAAVGRKAYMARKSQEKSRQDLLSFLFNAKDPNTGLPLAEDEIIAESISFIVGGSDTTSSTMTNIVDFLSRRPIEQKRLQAELDRQFLSPGETWVAPFTEVHSLPILNSVVKETMRLRPTSSTGLERVTPPGGRNIAGKYIPEGTLVSVPTVNILHHPKIFENPDKFDIDRWLQPDSVKLLEHFHPFSLGPRSCIGRSFAWMEILKTIATIFRHYEVDRIKSETTEIREGFFVKTSECWVTLRPRI